MDSASITEALSNVTTAAGECLEFIQGNVLLMTVFAGGIMSSIAFGFIRKAKRTAR